MRFDRRDLILLGIFTLFFGFLFMTGEPIYAGDTLQYERQMVMREPGYALLMQFCRFLQPNGFYWLVILVQNIVAILTNTVFMVWIRRRFDLNIAMTLLFTVILLTPHAMTPMFTHKNLVLTNTLMTEGILFSLYPLALMGMMDVVWDMKPLGMKSIGALAMFLLLSLIRGQMMVMFVLWFIVTCVIALRNRICDKKISENLASGRVKERIIYLLALVIMAFIVRSGIVHIYNYCENGLFVSTASGKAIAFANVLYAADREDGEAITDEGLRELFYEMYDRADADKMNYKYSPSGILNRAIHQEKCHDDLNFIYFAEPAKRYVGETKGIYVDRYQELMIEIDEVAQQIAVQIMPRLIGRYIYTYIAIAIQGFVRTVSYAHPVFIPYSVIVYIAATAVTIVLWRCNPKSRAASFMAVILLAIVGNVCAVALMLQCLSRYMIYNMPMFYVAGFLELMELVMVRRRGREEWGTGI